MTNIQQELAALRARIDELAGSIAALETEQQEAKWPQRDDNCWTVDGDGDLTDFYWCGRPYQLQRMEIGNVYRTCEEAEREVERRKVLTELRRLAKASWHKEPVNHAYYSLRVLNGVIDVCAYSYRRNELGVVYFAIEKDAQAAIKTIGAARLMLLLED